MSGSLAQLTTFVPNAFRVGPARPFKPEDTTLGEYTFLPWVRAGVAAAVRAPAAGATRAGAEVTIPVQDEAGNARVVKKTVAVRGPGDVLGFDLAQVVRRYPVPGAANAEDTFLAHVEFDRPDFPWLFTPFAPVGDKLAPWLALVVCEDARTEVFAGPAGLPMRLRTRLGELQPLGDSWAWAHAQVIGPPNGSGPTVADRLSAAYGPVNLSRLLCPRRLAQHKGYHACVVPAFDAGVKAGLGLTGGTLAPAWTRAAGDENTEIVLPVYDFWRFSVGPAGDFESLAERLRGVSAPWSVGRRIVDTSRPGGGIADLAADAPGRVQVLRCALTAPASAPKPPDAPAETSAWSAAKTEELRQELNRADELAGKEAAPGAGGEDLPLIGPRIYARFQRGQSRVEAANAAEWFGELNLVPAHRVVAGLGTRVVRKDQEQLMQAAWAQVGAVDAANREIRRAQLARFASASLHARHFGKLALGDLAQVTRGVHGKLRLGPTPLTVVGVAARSAAAPAALTGAFRRATRARGPLARYVDLAGRNALRTLVATGETVRDFRRPYAEPDGVATLSRDAIAELAPDVTGRVLGVAPAQALAEVSARVARTAALPTAADQLLSRPETWRPLGAGVDLGAIAAGRMLRTLRAAIPADPVAARVRTESVGALLTAFAGSGAAGADEARGLVERLPGRASGGGVPGGSLPGAVHPGAVHPGVGQPGAVHPGVGRPPIGVVGPGNRPVLRPDVRPGAGATAAGERPGPAGGPNVAAGLRIDVASAVRLGAALGGPKAAAAKLVAGLAEVARDTGVLALPRTPDRAPLELRRAAVLDAINPRATITAHLKTRLTSRPHWLPADWFDDGLVQPIMAAPVFTRPMYEALDAYDREWLVPGLGKIAESDFVTLLETNPVFTEAFLAGLSDEMGRELLWRGYPTDQRATYFRRFWDADQDELAQDLHRFARTRLGTHLKASEGGSDPRVVLVVRGELIRRYPDAILLALRAGVEDPTTHHPTFVDPASDPTSVARILFHAHLKPDIALVGFNLTVKDVQRDPWWFVIAEHPTAPRFGLDQGDRAEAAAPARNAVDWDDFGALRFGRFLPADARSLTVRDPGRTPATIAWPGHAATVAHVLLQSPLRAAFDASKLLAPALGGP